MDGHASEVPVVNRVLVVSAVESACEVAVEVEVVDQVEVAVVGPVEVPLRSSWWSQAAVPALALSHPRG